MDAFSLSTLLNMNFMTSLRTGDIVVDMLIAMLIPIVSSAVRSICGTYIPMLIYSLMKKADLGNSITIEYTMRTQYCDAISRVNENSILNTAVMQYIGRTIHTGYHLGVVNFTKLPTREARLDANERKGTMSLSDIVKSHHLVHLPVRNTEVEILPGIWYEHTAVGNGDDGNDSDDEGRGKKKIKRPAQLMRLQLRSWGFNGQKRVASFLQDALDWYIHEVETAESTLRHLYQPLLTGGSQLKEQVHAATLQIRRYKRYPLTSEKTFNSLFFPEKNHLLQVIDDFEAKKGKYTIKGFPHKLSLLLYGPPGTGKTSLVKAVAAYTNRNVVTVPLCRIRTNQELLDLMFGDDYLVYKRHNTEEESSMESDWGMDDGDGDDDNATKIHLPMEKVIFLLEDVDAASDVVLKAPKSAKSPSQRVFSSLPGVNASEEPEEEEDCKTRKTLETADEDEDDDEEEADQRRKKKRKEKIKDALRLFLEKDKLSLSGLLATLDGILDAPKRIVIMTTNHPENLHPDLLRPGRINMQIHMGYLDAQCLCEMVSHYYPTEATPEALARVHDAFQKLTGEKRKVTPAEIEQKCAESDSIDELCATIQLGSRRLEF